MPGMSKELDNEKAFTLKDMKPSELFGLHRPGKLFRAWKLLAPLIGPEPARGVRMLICADTYGAGSAGNTFGQDIVSYVKALVRTPQNVMARSWAVPNMQDTEARIDARQTGAMKKSLNWCAAGQLPRALDTQRACLS